jgi:DNA-binding Xre family transcriptional regulator
MINKLRGLVRMPEINIMLRELLDERGMTLSALSKLSKVRFDVISNLSHGNVERLSLEHLKRIMTALEIKDVGEILKYVDEPMKEEIKDPLDVELELLELPTRIYNALKRNWQGSKNTIRDLVNADLEKAHNIGPSSRKIIEEAIACYLKKYK